MGGHRRHEAVLKTLSDPANLLHELLGTGKEFDYPHQARKYRNVWRKDRTEETWLKNQLPSFYFMGQ